MKAFMPLGVCDKANAKTHILESFSVYCPKCFGGIGHLPDTVTSRSIVIEVRRELPGEAVKPFRQRTVRRDATPIKAELEAWAATGVAADLANIIPAPIPGLGDRQNDISEPLLAIARLADIRSVFDERSVDAVSSKDLAACLCSIEGRPWAEMACSSRMTIYAPRAQMSRRGDLRACCGRVVDLLQIRRNGYSLSSGGWMQTALCNPATLAG